MSKPSDFTPPPTGSLPEFFSGSTYKSTLDSRVNGPVVLSPVPTRPPDNLFNGSKDVGRSISATTASVTKFNHR